MLIEQRKRRLLALIGPTLETQDKSVDGNRQKIIEKYIRAILGCFISINDENKFNRHNIDDKYQREE